MMKPKRTRYALSCKTRQRMSLLGLISIGVTLLVILGVSAIFVLPRILPHPAAVTPRHFVTVTPRILPHSATVTPPTAIVNTDCTLLIPANPLSAQGLATPYQLSATNPFNGPCHEGNPNQSASAFVQGVIYDPATGAFSVYSPLITDVETRPAVMPVPLALPQGAVVALWFGFNGNNLTLQGTANDTLRQANCVNGLPGSTFGQFSYCNAALFFRAVNQGIAAGKVQVPTLGIGNDGLSCPTVRDFGIVDEDQSDNVQTQYLMNTNGQTAQFSATNQVQIQNATTIVNMGDNTLLTNVIDPALGCTPWMVSDLANNNTPVSTLPLDELMAAANQQAPVALIPINDPRTLDNEGKPSLQKTNLYRIGVDQLPAQTQTQASTTTYCRNLITVALPRLQLDMAAFQNRPSPDGGTTSNSLFTYLASRLNATLSADGLNCVGLLNMRNPITLTTDGNGVVLSATFNTRK